MDLSRKVENMVLKQSDILKSISEKHGVNPDDVNKVLNMFEDCIQDYLTSVKEGEENVIFPFKGYRLSSRLVKRKNSRGGRGHSVVVNANFTERFKDRINRDKYKTLNRPWYL